MRQRGQPADPHAPPPDPHGASPQRVTTPCPALLGIANRHRLEPPDATQIVAVQKARDEAQRSLADELIAAAADLRSSAAQLSEQLAKAAQVAEKITDDSPVARAAAPIKQTI